MADIKVSSETLISAAGQLQSGSGDLQNTLSQLNNLVSSLGSDWQGSGSSAFAELFNEFHQAGTKLQESLSGISSMLRSAANYYAESEQNVTSAFRS